MAADHKALYVDKSEYLKFHNETNLYRFKFIFLLASVNWPVPDKASFHIQQYKGKRT